MLHQRNLHLSLSRMPTGGLHQVRGRSANGSLIYQGRQDGRTGRKASEAKNNCVRFLEVFNIMLPRR
jgi:hypothetical protein